MKHLAAVFALSLSLLTPPWAPAIAASHAAARCAAEAENGAVAACEKAARENPGDVKVQRDLARSFIAIGDFDSAVDVYQRIAAARPDDARAHHDLGGTLGFVRRYAEAIEPMEAVMRLKPRDVAAYKAAAVVYTQLGRVGDAVRVTRKAADLGDAIAMFDLSRFYRDGTGVSVDSRQALAWAQRAAEQGHLGALDLMVRVYLEGLMGEAVDEQKAKAWAWKYRRARLGPDAPSQR